MADIQIQHLARLSGLTLTKEEEQKFLKQMEETVEYIQNLNELDTQETSPTASPCGSMNVFQEDGGQNRRTLSPALYKVKRIL